MSNTEQAIELFEEDCWVTVENLSVHVIRTDEGAVVDIWGAEGNDFPLATTYAFFTEAEEE